VRAQLRGARAAGETSRVRTRVLAVALSAALVAGCGGAAKEDPPRTPPDPGFTGTGTMGSARPVDIGGRSLFVECHGSGSPTVLLEAGFGGSSKSWVTVMPALSRITRTCAYDRAGLGSSVAIPGVHDASDEVSDLGRLLAQARIPPPYVLVGHSYGGLLVRLFAHAHPQQTRGVVLVDAVGRDAFRRERAEWPPSIAPAARHALTAPVEQGVDVRPGAAADDRIRSLGDLPLIVITAGHEYQPTAGVPPWLYRRGMRLWHRMQDELTRLSSDRVHVVAVRSDHFVQDDQPDVVIHAVQAVVRAERTRTRLPACGHLFTGPDVRCLG
jgi:pimeloyl-ACP methyl ester carboxylesterase